MWRIVSENIDLNIVFKVVGCFWKHNRLYLGKSCTSKPVAIYICVASSYIRYAGLHCIMKAVFLYLIFISLYPISFELHMAIAYGYLK